MKRTALLLAMLVCIASVSAPGAAVSSARAPLSVPQQELSAGAISLDRVLKRRDAAAKLLQSTQRGSGSAAACLYLAGGEHGAAGIPPAALGTAYDITCGIYATPSRRIFHIRE